MASEDEKRKRAVIKRALAKVQDYQQVFSTEQGKRVLYDMFNSHFMIGPLPRDTNDLLRAEGERNVVLRILSKLKVSTEKVHKLIGESDKHAENDQNIIG